MSGPVSTATTARGVQVISVDTAIIEAVEVYREGPVAARTR